MKRLTLYILIVLIITCGCGLNNKNLSQETSIIVNNQNDETFSQPNNQEIINQETSLNKEEPQTQEKEQKEELEENIHPIDKAERDCIAMNMTTAGMSNCSYIAMDAWFKEIDKYVNLLKDVTSKDEYNNILEAQTQWKKYQEAEFKAVNFIMPVIMLLGAIGFMFGAGGSALISKTLGEGEKKKANGILSRL